jgi:hypothetical protein
MLGVIFVKDKKQDTWWALVTPLESIRRRKKGLVATRSSYTPRSEKKT